MSNSSLTIVNDDGFQELAVAEFEYQALNDERQEQRFLTLFPCPVDDKNDPACHVKCSLTTCPVDEAGDFIAVRNSRGYRRIQAAIEIDGAAMIIPVALERFLRNYRRQDEPVKLWIRHICLQEFRRKDEPPGEQERYWNRAWIDSMYERAVEVVDMAAFNTQLIDDGVIEHLVDTRYREWTKEWSRAPGQKAVLPSVFPFRLGQRPNNSEPQEYFKHVPLDEVVREIRLILLVPSEDPEEQVVAHLAHCPMKCEVDYHALSYTWGSADEKAEIVLNGQRMVVRKNLDDALRAIRRPKQPIVVWTDAICIDQTNIPERNRHLPRMASIYDTATGVISYVGATGDEDEDAELALKLIPLLHTPMMRMDENGHWIIKEKDTDNLIEVDRYPRLCGALYRFLTRPYFRRVWILQEVANASNLIVGCGDNFELSFEDIERASSHLQDMLQRDPELKAQIVASTPGLGSISLHELSHVRKLFYFRFLMSGGSDAVTSLFSQTNVNQIRSESPGFLETAILTRDFEATDSRDKIFALWNLARDKKQLKISMDYEKSVSETYEEFARAWATQHGSLDIIGAAEAARDNGNEKIDTCDPSWSPNWAVRSLSSCLIRREILPQHTFRWFENREGPLYSADGAVKNTGDGESLFTFDGSRLHATGVIVDSLEGWFHRSTEHEKKGSSEVDTSEIEEADLRRGQFNAICHVYESDSYTCPYPNAEQAAVAMFHGDVPSAWPPRDQHPQPIQESHKRGNFLCDTSKSRQVEFYGGSYSHVQAGEVSKAVLRGREPCITEKGYMCLAPEYLKPSADELKRRKNEEFGENESAGKARPMLVAILATCSVPVILIPLDDDTYQLAGTVLMQGWMEGEGLREMMGVDDLKEFWKVLSDGGKLTIK